MAKMYQTKPPGEGVGPEQLEVFRRMTPVQKLRAVFALRRLAIMVKRAAANSLEVNDG